MTIPTSRLAYQLDRMLAINPNPRLAGMGGPDHGYSSWLTMPDGGIYLVDYSNRGDKPPQSHLYAARFTAEDFSK